MSDLDDIERFRREAAVRVHQGESQTEPLSDWLTDADLAAIEARAGAVPAGTYPSLDIYALIAEIRRLRPVEAAVQRTEASTQRAELAELSRDCDELRHIGNVALERLDELRKRHEEAALGWADERVKLNRAEARICELEAALNSVYNRQP